MLKPIDTVPGVLQDCIDAPDGICIVSVADGATTATVELHERTATGGHSAAAVTMDISRLRRFAIVLLRAAQILKE